MPFMYPAREADQMPHVCEQAADEIVSLGPKVFLPGLGPRRAFTRGVKLLSPLIDDSGL